MWSEEKLREAAYEWMENLNPYSGNDWDKAETAYQSFLAGCDYIINNTQKKMKATELRIGDWVSVDGEPIKIAETDLTYFTAWKKDGTFCGKIGYEAAEPILLTEELLEKNGWTYSDPFNDWEILNDGRVPRLYEGVKEWFVRPKGGNYDLCAIRYVHELQHLLWALGVEKEVEL